MRRSIRCFHISPGQPPRVFELYKTGWFRLKFTKKELIYRTKKKNWFENIKKRNILSGIFWNEVFILSNLFIYLFIHSFVDIVNKFLGRKGNVLRSSCVGVLIKIVRFIIVKTMFASKKGC